MREIAIFQYITIVNIENANSLSDFIGERIINILRSEFEVKFIFSEDKAIAVSLRENDWYGPEAMQIRAQDKIYIWN